MGMVWLKHKAFLSISPAFRLQSNRTCFFVVAIVFVTVFAMIVMLLMVGRRVFILVFARWLLLLLLFVIIVFVVAALRCFRVLVRARGVVIVVGRIVGRDCFILHVSICYLWVANYMWMGTCCVWVVRAHCVGGVGRRRVVDVMVARM